MTTTQSPHQSWREVPKPPAIAALPTDERGYSIFFSIQPPEGAVLNFRATNPANMLRAAKERLCGVCGQPLAYWYWFLGGPYEVEDRAFPEPPMHKSCLDYALLVCPFLSRRYEPTHKPIDGNFQVYEGVKARQVGKIALYRTRSYLFTVYQDGQVVWRPAAPHGIEWREHFGTDGEVPS